MILLHEVILGQVLREAGQQEALHREDDESAPAFGQPHSYAPPLSMLSCSSCSQGAWRTGDFALEGAKEGWYACHEGELGSVYLSTLTAPEPQTIALAKSISINVKYMRKLIALQFGFLSHQQRLTIQLGDSSGDRSDDLVDSSDPSASI